MMYQDFFRGGGAKEGTVYPPLGIHNLRTKLNVCRCAIFLHIDGEILCMYPVVEFT